MVLSVSYPGFKPGWFKTWIRYSWPPLVLFSQSAIGNNESLRAERASLCFCFSCPDWRAFSISGVFTSHHLRESPQNKDLFTLHSNAGSQMERVAWWIHGQSCSCLFIFLLHLTCLFTNSSLNHGSRIFVVLVSCDSLGSRLLSFFIPELFNTRRLPGKK